LAANPHRGHEVFGFMPGEPSHSSLSELPSAGRRRRWSWRVGLVALVLLWLAAMLFRTDIRTRWWAYRLGQTGDPAARRYYTACLAATGSSSLSATRRLLDHPRPEVRLAALQILHHCPAPAARGILVVAIADRDDRVSDRAALELALRSDRREAVGELEAQASSSSPAIARKAVVGLQRLGEPEAEDFLLGLLRRTSDPDLRAQIIDALGLMGSRSAVPALIDCLADQRAISHPPASYRWANQAIQSLESQLPAQGLDPAALRSASVAPCTVAGVAERALAWITGISGGDPNAERDQDRSEAIGRWREWHRAPVDADR